MDVMYVNGSVLRSGLLSGIQSYANYGVPVGERLAGTKKEQATGRVFFPGAKIALQYVFITF